MICPRVLGASVEGYDRSPTVPIRVDKIIASHFPKSPAIKDFHNSNLGCGVRPLGNGLSVLTDTQYSADSIFPKKILEALQRPADDSIINKWNQFASLAS